MIALEMSPHNGTSELTPKTAKKEYNGGGGSRVCRLLLAITYTYM
jgi:hypothetical protein